MEEEELDLDSLLDSQSVDDGDRDGDANSDDYRPPSIPHQTVDEIFLLHDFSSSSSSSSPSSSPSPPSASSTTAAAARNNLNHNYSLDYSSAMLRSFDSALLYSSPSSLPDSPSSTSSIVVVLPPLFTAVKSNVKPGAALATTATASRSIPTPHATAIKSSRATSSSSSSSPRSQFVQFQFQFYSIQRSISQIFQFHAIYSKRRRKTGTRS